MLILSFKSKGKMVHLPVTVLQEMSKGGQGSGKTSGYGKDFTDAYNRARKEGLVDEDAKKYADDYVEHLKAGTPQDAARALAEPKNGMERKDALRETRDNAALVIRSLRHGFRKGGPGSGKPPGYGDKVKVIGQVNHQGKTGIVTDKDSSGAFSVVRIGDSQYSFHDSDLKVVSSAQEEYKNKGEGREDIQGRMVDAYKKLGNDKNAVTRYAELRGQGQNHDDAIFNTKLEQVHKVPFHTLSPEVVAREKAKYRDNSPAAKEYRRTH